MGPGHKIITSIARVKPGDMVKLRGGRRFYKCLKNIWNSRDKANELENWHLQVAYEPNPWEQSDGTKWVHDLLFDYAEREN
ncbi:MAG: hypothetical protein [Caudoviricetes sp.]|nr:MAG: hypothetical protein [Caudoviricetes sp.]